MYARHTLHEDGNESLAAVSEFGAGPSLGMKDAGSCHQVLIFYRKDHSSRQQFVPFNAMQVVQLTTNFLIIFLKASPSAALGNFLSAFMDLLETRLCNESTCTVPYQQIR